MREVFEELGLKDDTLEQTCTAVGSSDENLLEFMKVRVPLGSCMCSVQSLPLLIECTSGFRVRLQR